MPNPSLNKVTVMPQVVIYKGLLKNTDKILDVLKKSQSDFTEKSFFPEWQDWSPGNNNPGSIVTVDVFKNSMEISENDSEIAVEQKNVSSKIYEAFHIAKDDFLKDWAGKGSWPDLISSWDTSDTTTWYNRDFNVLGYKIADDNPNVHDPKNNKYNLPMNYHVDNMNANLSDKGTKLAITVTMYLNDDYEGGEISFYDSVENKIYNYKPRPGDVTVFPSFEPFYHGVLPMSGNTRYLVRCFLMYEYEGSDEWKENSIKYSSEELKEIYNQKRLEAFEKAEHVLHVVYEGEVNTGFYKKAFINSAPIRVE